MISSDEADKLAADMLANRRIAHSVYCGRCGYNLRMATYAGHCTECGNEYNARPTVMKGIFWPHDVQFPMSDILLSALCLLMGGAIIRSGINPVSDWMIFGGSRFAILGLLYLREVYRKLKKYFTARGLLKHINAEEED